jgi:hypothetical protein
MPFLSGVRSSYRLTLYMASKHYRWSRHWGDESGNKKMVDAVRTVHRYSFPPLFACRVLLDYGAVRIDGVLLDCGAVRIGGVLLDYGAVRIDAWGAFSSFSGAWQGSWLAVPGDRIHVGLRGRGRVIVWVGSVWVAWRSGSWWRKR